MIAEILEASSEILTEKGSSDNFIRLRRNEELAVERQPRASSAEWKSTDHLGYPVQVRLQAAVECRHVRSRIHHYSESDGLDIAYGTGTLYRPSCFIQPGYYCVRVREYVYQRLWTQKRTTGAEREPCT